MRRCQPSVDQVTAWRRDRMSADFDRDERAIQPIDEATSGTAITARVRPASAGMAGHLRPRDSSVRAAATIRQLRLRWAAAGRTKRGFTKGQVFVTDQNRGRPGVLTVAR